MKRPDLKEWTVWIAVSLPVSAFLIPVAGFGIPGSAGFALLMWTMVFIEFRNRGFGTRERVAANVLFQTRPELASAPLELYADVGVCHSIGRFAFPKRLSNAWTASVFVGLAGGMEMPMIEYANTGMFSLSSYSFALAAEAWFLVVVQMVFWTRFNLTYHNWKTPRKDFETICQEMKLNHREKRQAAWHKCLLEGLVVEN